MLARHPAVGLAFVYGSVARGAARPQSDLDVAVMGAQPLSADDTLGVIASLADASGRPVDLVDLRRSHGTLLHEILRTGRKVLDRAPGLHGSLLARHLAEEADFRPLRDRILAERRRAWTGA